MPASAGRAGAAVLLLACLALPLAALFSAPAQAQTVEVTSVSNHSGANASGNAGIGWFTASTRTAQAQQFTTGGGDYTLKSVEVPLRRVGSNVTVKVSIYTSTSGNKPGTSLYVLTNPASIFSHTNYAFTAPANAPLDPNTSYFVVFENTSSNADSIEDEYWIRATPSNAETGGPGWSIADQRRFREGDSNNWTSTNNDSIKIAIKTLVTNTPATGRPTISGTAQVGDTLTANKGTIEDVDGLPSFPGDYTFQWVRGSADIAGATSRDYTLTDDDQGSTIKVKVSFTDNEGFSEGPLESAATASVAAMPSNGCTPDDVQLVGGDNALEGEVEICHNNEWRNVCDDQWAKVDADVVCKQLGYVGARRATIQSEFVSLISVDYWLSEVGCTGSETSLADCSHAGWGTHHCTFAERAGVVCKSNILPDATGQPRIDGTPQVGQTLTARIGTIMDDDGLPSFPSGFDFQWVRVDADGSSNPKNVGTNSQTYTPVPADLGKKIKVKVSYVDGNEANEELESDATAKTAAALGPCPSGAFWCTTMTVGAQPVSSTVYGIDDSTATGHTFGSLDGNAFASFTMHAILHDTSTDVLSLFFDAFLPRGSVINLNGTDFRADAASEYLSSGEYAWSTTSSFGWIDGQKVTVGIRFPLPDVTITASKTEAVHGAEAIGFTVTRDGHTIGPLDVDVVLRPGRGHLPASARSRTITIPDGDTSASFSIQPGDYKDLDDGAWTTRPGSTIADIVERPWYELGDPASFRVEMNYAMTVGFGPFTSQFRVDEGSGTVDLTFYATSGPGLGAPTERVEVQYSTVDGTATAPADYAAGTRSFFFEPGDFEYDDAYDWYEATKTVTLPIRHDTSVEGNEWFRLRLERAASNGPEIVFVTDRGVRGVSCTPGATCNARVTIVDNDGITQPTENPDWTLTGSTRVFSGTSSAHRRPVMSGTETATRCLGGPNTFTLTDHNGNPVTGDIAYSLHKADNYAGYPGITQPAAVPGMFTIGPDGQIRTKVGTDYPNTESPDGNLRRIYANVRALHVDSNRYAEYRQGFVIIHPTATHFDHENPTCAELELNVLDPLTVAFADLPDTHDGATAFTFRLEFSEDIDIEPDEMRDHSLTVTGATVTAAARVDGRDDLWEITLTPDGEAEVAIFPPLGRACTEQGAFCTANGVSLSGTVPVPQIPYAAPTTDEAEGTDDPPGLTASFENVPASHDGSSTFTLELAFSEAPQVGIRRLRDEALSASGGTVRRARRTVQGQNDRWEIHVEPSGDGAVTVSLAATTGGCGDAGAICTADGTALSEAISTTIQGPELPELSIADAEVEEGPNAKLVFAITLSRASSSPVTFDIATSDGSAVAGEDYVAKSKTKTFPAGMTEGRFGIRVLDDGHDEESETMTVTISNVTGATIADGTATGTITNDDLMPQAWLARFGRTVADQVLDAVEGRMAAARAPGTEVSLAGQRVGAAGTEETDLDSREAEAGLETLTDWLRGAGGEEEASALTSRTASGRELLSGSSFALTAGSVERGFGALWGRGAVSRFDGREGDLTLDGEVASALLGADFALGRGTAGLVVAHSLGEGGYRSPSGGGAVETTLTGLYPWGRYAASERLSLWGVAGYGSGTLTLTPEGQAPIETDMALTMAALGGRGVVAEAPDGGGLELSVTSDALVVRTTSDEVRGSGGNLAASEADVTRLRLGLEGTWRGLGTLVPTLEVGARHDGGDAETGFGADIGGRLAWSDPALGIEAELAARGLLTHQDGSLSERGFSGSLAWDPSPDSERGAKLTLRHAVGAEATGGMDALLRPDTARVLEAANDDGPDRRRLEARFGYGIALFGGGWTGVPEVGLGLTETGREYIHAWRLLEARDAGLVFGLDVEGVRNERLDGDAAPEHRVGLGFGWRLEGARREDLELRFEASRLLPSNDEPESRIGVKLTARW